MKVVKIADEINNSLDKEGMLNRSLVSLVKLYTDNSHYIYELLQNAEDACAKNVKFIQFKDRLEFLHDGKPFTRQNLQSLRDIGMSDKQYNQIGQFGIGFKSVFGICETVKLYNNPRSYKESEYFPFAIKIFNFYETIDIPMEEFDESYTTKFVFPYSIKSDDKNSFLSFTSFEELNEKLSLRLQNLGITTLLFMKNLESIEYEIILPGQEKKNGCYMLNKERINNHVLVTALGEKYDEEENELLYSDNENNRQNLDEISYLVFSRETKIMPGKTIDIAFPVIVDGDGKYEFKKPDNNFISVYFPTETESKLNFIVQGPYQTTPNRTSVPSGESGNIMLAEETLGLLKDAILELRDERTLNLSFIKLLPIDASQFNNSPLFKSFYENILDFLSNERIIPGRNSDYVYAKYARIARNSALPEVFTDKFLTEVIADGNEYHWLQANITENDQSYRPLFYYFRDFLKIKVIDSPDINTLFINNPQFIFGMNNDWLADLYSIYAHAPNILNTKACIIKTSTGQFVPPYRSFDPKILNVFLFSEHFDEEKFNFVDPALYKKCKNFFDNTLGIQEPDEYECFIDSFKKRHSVNTEFNPLMHVGDIKDLIKYYNSDVHREEIIELIQDCNIILCTDGELHCTNVQNIYLSTADGINIENYFKNIDDSILYVKEDFYIEHGIDVKDLCKLGVKNSILKDDDLTSGYCCIQGHRKVQKWSTSTSPGFRWRLSLKDLEDVLLYISNKPSEPDSFVKSQTILYSLFKNEDKLSGDVFYSPCNETLKKETSTLVKCLTRKESVHDSKNNYWNGKWLYTKAGELVSQKDISKNDLDTVIYGKIRDDSKIYKLLEFKKTETETVDDLKKKFTEEELKAYFNSECVNEFGLSYQDIKKLLTAGEGISSKNNIHSPLDIANNFPVVEIKNWDLLEHHIAEMFYTANPTKYGQVLLSIRQTRQDKIVKAYLNDMYRTYGGSTCQLCHNTALNPRSIGVFYKPPYELIPMNLCLCPNCAAKYEKNRNDATLMQELKEKMLNMTKEEIIAKKDKIIIPIKDEELWFTQIHFAEIWGLAKKLFREPQQHHVKQPAEPKKEEIKRVAVVKKIRRGL